MVMCCRRRGLDLARQANGFLNRAVLQGVSGQLRRRRRDGDEVTELSRLLQAFALVAAGLGDVATCKIGIAEIAQDLVGQLLLPELTVDTQGAVAMLERL